MNRVAIFSRQAFMVLTPMPLIGSEKNVILAKTYLASWCQNVLWENLVQIEGIEGVSAPWRTILTNMMCILPPDVGGPCG